MAPALSGTGLLFAPVHRNPLTRFPPIRDTVPCAQCLSAQGMIGVMSRKAWAVEDDVIEAVIEDELGSICDPHSVQFVVSSASTIRSTFRTSPKSPQCNIRVYG